MNSKTAAVRGAIVIAQLFATTIHRPANAQAEKEWVLSLQSPVTARDIPGTDEVQVDASKADLTLTFTRQNNVYSVESVIDVSSVNQSMLPTDVYGRLAREASTLADRPFIRYYPTGRDPITLDISCTPRTCRAVWPKAPIDPVKPRSFQIEVNIRGMHGKHWVAAYNQAHFAPGSGFQGFPATPKAPARMVYFAPNFDWPGPQLTPLTRDQVKLNSLELWTLDAAQGTHFKKFKNITAYNILTGGVSLQITSGETLERREIPEGTIIWLFPGQVASITNAGPPYAETRILRLEFAKATP